MAEGGAPGGYLTALHARWLAEQPARRWQELDGTLLFADVSGFTVLGEKLAKQGRIGAEILTETVNTVFAGMLDVVTEEGVEILKFGGDAILALFTGPQHEIRGSSAGLGLQAMLRALRRERSVNLRLSAGVASGTAHLFLVGAAPRELIVAGPLATEVLAQESAAEAGQVLVSARTASALPAGCVGTDGALRRAPRGPRVAPPSPPAGFDPSPGLPLHLHAHVPGDAEHRGVTVAFVQFKGTDALLAEREPDALAQALDDIVGAAADAALSHGVTFVGTDVDQSAGKVILVAGAPTASPDDDDRMLHALRAIVAQPRGLAVRAGVNRGRVFTVDIGPEQRRTWTVMGDDVNLAARVMGRAEPGTVLATRSVLARLRDDFARNPVPPFTVKGKQAPVFAEEVGDARGARRAAAPAVPLVGRDRELAELREAQAEARLGADRVLELVGEPGIGKSRLIEALRAHLHELPLLLVQGGPYSAHSPYRALRTPLRQLIGCAPEDTPAEVAERLCALADGDAELAKWLPLVAIPFGADLEATPETAALSPEFARGRLTEWTVRLISRLLGDGPFAVIVEDGHWIDDASGDLLRALVVAPRSTGRLVVATRRDVPGGLRLGELEGAQTMALGPLDATAALALIGFGGEDHALPPGDEARLVERAGGNPLLLAELIAAARAGASVDELPDSVEALVTARMDTLPRGDRRLLREAAVLGIQVPSELLGRLLDADPFAVQAALRRLEDFLVPSRGGVRFRHALVRDAAYETLPFRRRRELHARAADLIEARAGDAAAEQAELLAIHYSAARRWDGAWHYGQIAAEQALTRAAPVEAAAFLERALEAGAALRLAPADLAAAGVRQSDAYRLAGRFDQAGCALEQARRRVRGDALREAAICHAIGRLRERSRHMAQSVRALNRGLKLLEGAPQDAETDSLRAQLWLMRATVRMRSAQMAEAVENALRAAEIAGRAGDRHALGRAYTVLHWAYTELGSEERVRYRGLAVEIFETLGDNEWLGKALNNLGIDAYYAGEWDEAVALYERGRAALMRAGDVVEAAVLVNNMAEIRSDQGHYEQAEAHFLDALATCRAAGFGQGVGIIQTNLGRLASRRGAADSAAEFFNQARMTMLDIGVGAKLLELDVHEAERLVLAGHPEQALRMAGSVRVASRARDLQPSLHAILQRVAAFSKLLTGDIDGARLRLRESVQLARDAGNLYEEALSLEALGRTGGPEAAAAAAEATALLKRLGVVALPAVPLPA